VDLVTGVQEDPEERVTQMTVDDLMEYSTGLTDVQRLVPLRDRFEVRSDQTFHVVLDIRGKLPGIRHDETGTAVQGTPDAEGRRELVSAFDAPIAGTQQTQ
jgi:hypothetical protein